MGKHIPIVTKKMLREKQKKRERLIESINYFGAMKDDVNCRIRKECEEVYEMLMKEYKRECEIYDKPI